MILLIVAFNDRWRYKWLGKKKPYLTKMSINVEQMINYTAKLIKIKYPRTLARIL